MNRSRILATRRQPLLMSRKPNQDILSLPLSRLRNGKLPPLRHASRPPEARGLARDEVGLLLSHYRQADAGLSHLRFRELSRVLQAGDLLVINTSATLPAALDARDEAGRTWRVHLSSRRDPMSWVVELRTPSPDGASTPFAAVSAGMRLSLAEGIVLDLLEPVSAGERPRLWLGRFSGPAWEQDWLAWLQRHGRPIRYGYVARDWPLDAYQTVFATEPGSAEMPSAGRAFTPELITALVARGIQVLPLTLHTGVSSLESHEAPYPEYYQVPEVTAAAVRAARQAGRRVIAVGTTVVRALESAAEATGQVEAGSGWTSLMITPERGLHAVDGLLTGFHEPEATHLAMLEALCGRAHLELAYAAALEAGYLWHEFGDLHLILP